ncbi:HlyD family secretion protein, partial [Zemynaea arenosa]|uniref:HlyD family secretion protein n=1 Tax=Zemynaea arenosa TaxID=2561931 RepID=UPI001E43FFBB
MILPAVAFAVIALLGVLVVLYAWNLPPFRTSVESTENAMVRGQVTIISPQLSGYVVEVAVQDFQRVHRGDLLVRIDDRIYRQRLEQARAQLEVQRTALSNQVQQRGSAAAAIEQNRAAVANAQALANRTAADLRRVEELAADGSLSARERDAARAARAQAVAAVEQARAALDIARQNEKSVGVNRASLQAAVANAQAAVQLAEIDLSNTLVLAPRDGQLGQVAVRQGAYVNAGTQVTAIVPDQMWVIANLKETQMAHVEVGQPVTMTVDALDHAEIRGHVERIAPATGSEFAVLQPDNATGNFVKIAQRIPVRVAIDANQPLAQRLRPGMSVVATINTGVRGHGQPGPATPDPARQPPAPG